MGGINAAIDASILILPIRMVWMLHMNLKQRLAICGVFALGLVGVAVSIARVVYLGTKGFEGGALAFAIWSTAEMAVGLICACLPVMRPLWTKAIGRWIGAGRGAIRRKSQGYAKHSGSITDASATLVEDKDFRMRHDGQGGYGFGRADKDGAVELSELKPLPPVYANRTPLRLSRLNFPSGDENPRKG